MELEDEYECLQCEYRGALETFPDTEYDGDVIGTCPKCKKYTIIIEVERTTEKVMELHEKYRKNNKSKS